MTQTKTGAATDLDDLVELHQRMVWRYLRALGARPAAADELMQETFVIAWQRGTPARTAGSAADGAFLRGIARNLWLRSVRAWRRRRESAIADEVDRLWVQDVPPDDDGDGVLARLRHCLQQLTERSRQALELTYHDDRPRRELAVRFGMKENGIKMLLQRARQALRECITRSRA